MKEYLANLVKQTPTTLEGRNLVREYLQARILESLQKSGAMIPLAFHGGTALHFLFHMAAILKILTLLWKEIENTIIFEIS